MMNREILHAEESVSKGFRQNFQIWFSGNISKLTHNTTHCNTGDLTFVALQMTQQLIFDPHVFVWFVLIKAKRNNIHLLKMNL